ncbi:MAG: hypothetical protein EGS41_04325 [Prevotella sp.]|jgi:hypothetical protein|nr:hypothetical protein [Prevotella sp.]MBD9299158.1 hypothetical protein [Prevotella sp.]
MDTDMRIIALYKEYNMVIKPLIAELEARTEQFPLPLFNEIRALHDHIARCYSERISSNQVDSEIHKAERHVTRIMLDCYKCLNLSLHDEVLLFERQTKNVDLTVLQNGTFYPKYKTLRTKATKMVRKAKSLESLDTQSALDTYQNSYNLYCDLENVIEEVVPDLHWARIRFSVRKSMQVLLWILSAIASGVISIILAKYL